MLIASRADFEPVDAVEGASALYYSPDGRGYREYAFFQARVNELKTRFAPNGQKTLVVGCGFGYLVRLAVTAGYDAYGLDVSSYAIDRGKALLPEVASRLVLGDALTAAGMDAVSAAAGLHGNPPRFDILVTEDFLECLTDTEISVGLPLWRARCRANLGHIVTPADEWGQAHGADSRINWKTVEEWRAIVSPPDVLIGPNGEQL